MTVLRTRADSSSASRRRAAAAEDAGAGACSPVVSSVSTAGVSGLASGTSGVIVIWTIPMNAPVRHHLLASVRHRTVDFCCNCGDGSFVRREKLRSVSYPRLAAVPCAVEREFPASLVSSSVVSLAHLLEGRGARRLAYFTLPRWSCRVTCLRSSLFPSTDPCAEALATASTTASCVSQPEAMRPASTAWNTSPHPVVSTGVVWGTSTKYSSVGVRTCTGWPPLVAATTLTPFRSSSSMPFS